MKGLPFTSKKIERVETFESAFAKLPQHEQQVLAEVLNDYFEDEHCWAWRDFAGQLCCAWCQASGEDALHLRHVANCPLGWLQARAAFLEDRLFKLPRLRIGRSRKTTQVIPEEKLLPGSVEEYVDGRRGLEPRGVGRRDTQSR